MIAKQVDHANEMYDLKEALEKALKGKPVVQAAPARDNSKEVQ
jgi:chromosome segregation ATPase